tara:strand:+ start:57 stop:1307 length:1251 start_codon:yes stop_codon:yes gene_type:complete
MRKELEPMEQAFLFLKAIDAKEIAEYQDGMLHGTSPYHSLRLNPAKFAPPAKARELYTNENRRFLSDYNLSGKRVSGTGLPTNQIIERLYGTKHKIKDRRNEQNNPLPLLDPVTGESLYGRFAYPAEAFSFNPNLTDRGHLDTQGNIIDMNALTRAKPDLLPTAHNQKMNLYGFEGIDPQRFGTNIQPEGIIYGDVDESQVHQLNDKPMYVADISQASRLLNPLVDSEKELDDMKEMRRKRILSAAQALMTAQIPPVMMDSQGLDLQGIWSPDDPKLAEPNNATLLHDPFKQWDKGAGYNTGELHEQLNQGAISPEQLELLDHELIYSSEPMDIAMRLLKERVSPEAKRHKLEYDKKYESSPERVKYREDLNRERRRRHIMGQGGPDMSHTRQHTIVPEDPHTNRARHFKDKGTLL